jgi:hypothetical protein
LKRQKKGQGDEEKLPPLDHDETVTPDPDTLVEYLDVEPEGESFLDLDDQPAAESDFLTDDAIVDTTAESWVTEADEVGRIEVTLDIDDQGDGWAEEGADSPVDLGDDWLVHEDEPSGIHEDGGAEGPVGDEPFILGHDAADLEPLDGDDEDDAADEEILDAMKRLGITLPDYGADEFSGKDQPGSDHLLERVFLGPENNTAVAGAFVSGSPIGVGDGLFVLGADGMLHTQVGSERLGPMKPTCVCVDDESIYVGTERGGALKTVDQGRNITPINSWYTLGLTEGVDSSSNRLSTPFHLCGQNTDAGHRLVGLTAQGQLFYSHDQGRSWSNLRADGRCIQVALVGGTTDLIALVESREGEPLLYRSRDITEWRNLPLPTGIGTTLDAGKISIAANGDCIILARDAAQDAVHISLDCAESWISVETLARVTALAIDPVEPTWTVAATYEPGPGTGTVWISEDSGINWQAVFSTGEEETSPSGPGDSQARFAHRVTDLVIDAGRVRRVMAVTPGGIYLATLTRPGVSH